MKFENVLKMKNLFNSLDQDITICGSGFKHQNSSIIIAWVVLLTEGITTSKMAVVQERLKHWVSKGISWFAEGI